MAIVKIVPEKDCLSEEHCFLSGISNLTGGCEDKEGDDDNDNTRK